MSGVEEEMARVNRDGRIEDGRATSLVSGRKTFMAGCDVDWRRRGDLAGAAVSLYRALGFLWTETEERCGGCRGLRAWRLF